MLLGGGADTREGEDPVGVEVGNYQPSKRQHQDTIQIFKRNCAITEVRFRVDFEGDDAAISPLH